MGHFQLSKRYPRGYKGSRIQGFKCKGRGRNRALELKKVTWATIYGIDKNPDHLEKALELGIIYKKATIDIVKEVDIVIIAVPVNIIPHITLQVLDLIDDNTLVFDVGSTKAIVCEAVKKHPKRENFVAIHPIAGTEFSGPEAAIYDLFTGKVNIICEQNLSKKEMIEKAVSLFKSKKSVTVFLTNAKISRFNFKDFVVPYIIRFDSWWNPAALWQTKNLFNLSASNNENNIVNVFTYKMLDTIDELIKRTLISKDFIDDNIISAMSPATVNDIISVDEWLKVFDLPVNDEQENYQELYEETIEKLYNLSLEDYRKTLSSFFLKIGYAKIKILNHENSESFDITGEGKSGTQKVSLFSIVLLDEIITRKKIKKIIVDVSLAQKNNTFIITRGKFEKGCTDIAKNNVTLLDVEKLAAYMVNLRLVSSQPGSQTE